MPIKIFLLNIRDAVYANLKDGEYGNIMKHWMDSMDQSIGIVFDRIIRIQRMMKH